MIFPRLEKLGCLSSFSLSLWKLVLDPSGCGHVPAASQLQLCSDHKALDAFESFSDIVARHLRVLSVEQIHNATWPKHQGWCLEVCLEMIVHQVGNQSHLGRAEVICCEVNLWKHLHLSEGRALGRGGGLSLCSAVPISL